MKKFFALFLGFLFVLATTLTSEPSVLSQNVKEISQRLQDLALYPNLSKKRLYGAVTKGGAIRFDLKSGEEAPQSLGIGIATDGTIKEWVLTVYAGNGLGDSPIILRKERITDESQWVFELLAPPEEVVVEIQSVTSSNGTAVVEIVHGYYFGYSIDKENQNKPITQPGKQNPAEQTDKLTPNEVQNKVEIYRAPFTKD
ncbi:hypothetical protein P3G55_15100 [Leptospira sp. 96542]|nr:hypothetical protein [Leptospira sp. 96542]